MMEHKLLDEIGKRRLTVEDFASQCGINRATIYHYIEGRTKKMNRYILGIMANNLNISYEEMMAICPPRV